MNPSGNEPCVARTAPRSFSDSSELSMVVPSIWAVFRFPFCRFAVLASRSFNSVSRFPFCRFSQL